MRVVAAIDSFKGSMSSLEAGSAAAEGIRRIFPEADIDILPLADGGEGTVKALVSGMNGVLHKITVTGPIGEPVACEYGLIEERKMAVIEISGAAGITLLTHKERNPLHTTTYGVGEVIRDAIEKGCRRFLIGLGGSATNDGGIGMLQALGYGMLNGDGNQVEMGAKGLSELVCIDDSHVIPQLRECQFKVACDVSNTLWGKQGCSQVFGPQKGAAPTMIHQMDQWMKAYAELTQKNYSKANHSQAGSGAAGGLGFAFLTFTNAVLESGVKIILEETKLEDYIKNADIVITGEGRLDAQTSMGKAPMGVAKLAKKYGKTVIAFAGSIGCGAKICNENGIDAYFPILREVTTLEEAMDLEKAKCNMADTAEQVFRLWKN